MPNRNGTLPGDVFLILAPSGRDAHVICQMLESVDLCCEIDETGERLLAAIVDGSATGAIVTDDAIARVDEARLHDAIERQPPWSDFPFLLLSRRGETPRQGSRSIENLVNVTILERPLHATTLVSAARSAVRARNRQRMAADHFAEREAAEARLRELAETLEHKVQERTRDLAAANDRLTAEIAERERAEARLVQAQKMEAVGQLTGGIAHDFNNLLTAVIGSLDLLLRRTDDEKLRRLAGNALKSAERGAALTGQLLSFSRRQRLTPIPIEPNSAISAMGDLLGRSIGSHVRIETRLQPDLWRALADPTQLEVVILNLAINARDAMPEGGRVTISTRNIEAPPPALAGELAPGQYVEISVSDNGPGMSPSVLARAFEPFFTTKAPGKGTGLGLSQVYGFAKQSGGTARIESVEGEGTTVTIYLPRTTAEAPAGDLGTAQAQVSGRPRILLVDDDDNVRSVAAAMIEDIGYDVVAVSSGAEALEALDGGGFHLLITDVAMPDMTGVELARRVRGIKPELPIQFASGYADLEIFGTDLANEEVLKKPYRIAEMASRIAAMLDGRRRDPGARVVPIRG